MELAKFIDELVKISGLDKELIASKIGKNKSDLDNVANGSLAHNDIAKLANVVCVLLSGNALLSEKLDSIDKAESIILSVAESPELRDHHQGALSVACELLRG